jgi:hypothetical protein
MNTLPLIDYLKNIFRSENRDKIEAEKYLKEKLKAQQEKNTLVLKQEKYNG